MAIAGLAQAHASRSAVMAAELIIPRPCSRCELDISVDCVPGVQSAELPAGRPIKPLACQVPVRGQGLARRRLG